ncbi:MAG: hypothetical protein CO150_07650 [Nitrospirae bacterium CG_4_9_14_3_um_filter_53_35]|nr:MAG: hypothetical protein AUK29_01875 [Nitrospirae bacterium CG2_30_53_67]PIS36975.1 MAG: hypothetical protein COT35_08590 [Nitrospirae bacterium CG08_land_8_20_14_0_20_52_24]PIV83142.1 MAG: hypothetical protein COW52_09990 [Nitrospirae bacterium CG17_big_fil_post_rev_8_21_14_2_50_50_9]PIW84507.1 MAG: hypothetical protein COZ95_09480 [Nitrospirae bacterium CG_4_8_14_3_um_filter_50_41]PIX85256.1 MAG: hypothetical protein COZ32_09425 [Nitrospirae bacterium CG_4_10_14_3_um_filter_53_41]PJA7365
MILIGIKPDEEVKKYHRTCFFVKALSPPPAGILPQEIIPARLLILEPALIQSSLDESKSSIRPTLHPMEIRLKNNGSLLFGLCNPDANSL